LGAYLNPNPKTKKKREGERRRKKKKKRRMCVREGKVVVESWILEPSRAKRAAGVW
jgi:hypothetical protein